MLAVEISLWVIVLIEWAILWRVLHGQRCRLRERERKWSESPYLIPHRDLRREYPPDDD